MTLDPKPIPAKSNCRIFVISEEHQDILLQELEKLDEFEFNLPFLR